jgi:hypothetical protein
MATALTPTTQPTATEKAVAACERLVKVLTNQTGFAWTFGYIGNCSGIPGTPRFQDDRRWYGFAAHPGRVGTSQDSIGGVRTEDLDTLVTLLQGAVRLATVLAQPR